MNTPDLVDAYVNATYTYPGNGKTYNNAESIIAPTAPMPPASTTDCTKPENMVLPVCMAPASTGTNDTGHNAAPVTTTIDVAGYSFMTAMDPNQFMIGFKLSNDPDKIAKLDEVDLVLYTTDGGKTVVPLSQ